MDEKHIKLFEDFFSLTYDESYDYGDVNGIIHTNLVNVENWCIKRRIDPDAIRQYLTVPVAFLNNINVYEEDRGKGYGFQLYDDFESYCCQNGADAIILESDSGESQVNGFVLDVWYEKIGFTEIYNNSGDKIMYKKIVPYDDVDREF